MEIESSNYNSIVFNGFKAASTSFVFVEPHVTHWGKNQLFIKIFHIWCLKNVALKKCHFCWMWDLKKIRVLWKMRLVNLVKNETLKMWISSKNEFSDKLRIFAPIYLCRELSYCLPWKFPPLHTGFHNLGTWGISNATWANLVSLTRRKCCHLLSTHSFDTQKED